MCQGQAAPVLHPEVSSRTVGGAGMEVAARGGDRGVPERLLRQVDGRAPVEAVARMSIAQPVRRDLGGEAGPRGGRFHDPVRFFGGLLCAARSGHASVMSDPRLGHHLP
jgi:hypothetical protein